MNFGKRPDVAAPAPADLVKPPKFSNLKRVNVYGYDTADGRVPKNGRIVLIAGFVGVPKGVKAPEWDALKTFAGRTVADAYDSRLVETSAVRRSYRAGAIRFDVAAAPLEAAPEAPAVDAAPEVTPEAPAPEAEPVAETPVEAPKRGRKAKRG
jgi:hypothetical protein